MPRTGIRKCIPAVYTKICMSTLGIYYFVFFFQVYGCFLYLIHYTRFTASRLVSALFRKKGIQAKNEENIYLPKPNPLVHVIRNALEARLATALHDETTISVVLVCRLGDYASESCRGKTSSQILFNCLCFSVC